MTAFARNNSLTSQQLRYRSQSSASSQGSFVDPEGSVGFRKDLAQIVTCDTTEKEDNKMESFHPQQRRETGGNAKMLIQDGSVNMHDFLRIPKKGGETLDKCDDSRRLSQNSTDSDFYGSSHGSSPDSMESTEQTTLEEHDGSHMQHDEETSMEDSGSTQTSGTTLVASETLTSLSSTSSTQHLQHSLSSLSVSTAMPPATPTHEPAMSLEETEENLKRIREENQGKITRVENLGKFVHPQQMSDLVPRKTEEELEAPCPFLPKGCHPDFDIEYVQDCQLAESQHFARQERRYYQEMVAQPLPEEEEVIEETLNHRNCVKEVGIRTCALVTVCLRVGNSL